KVGKSRLKRSRYCPRRRPQMSPQQAKKRRQSPPRRMRETGRSLNAKARAGGGDAAAAAEADVIDLPVVRGAMARAASAAKRSRRKPALLKTAAKPNWRARVSLVQRATQNREPSAPGQNISGRNPCCFPANQFPSTSHRASSLTFPRR